MSGSAPQSPTALIQAYLASKGLPVTAQNVSRALQMNASNPGIIPGLTNQAPPPPDAPRSPVAGPGSPPHPQAQAQPQQQPMPTPPVPPQQVPGAQASASGPLPNPGSGSPSGAAPPPQDSNWLVALMQTILGGGAGAIASKALGGNEATPMGVMPMPYTGKAPLAPAIASSPQPPLALPPPTHDPLEVAMMRALGNGSATAQPQISGPQPGLPQLPAPGERPAIPMPNQASGPTIALPHSPAPYQGAPEPLNMGAVRPQGELPGMGDAIDWSKIMGELPALFKGVAR